MTEGSVDFDYREIDVRFGNEIEEENQIANALTALSKIFAWIDKGNSALAKVVRIQAVKFFLTPGKTQTTLGRQIGVGKAAVSKAANLFRDEFRTDEFLQKTPKMRNAETREKLSKLCKQRHQKKSSASKI